MEAGSAAGRSSYAGQLYYFCSSSCHSKFNAHPEKFIDGKNASADGLAAASVSPPGRFTIHDSPFTIPHSPPPTLYTCPMHPEIERDQPGDCPICGMALELKTISADSTEDNS